MVSTMISWLANQSSSCPFQEYIAVIRRNGQQADSIQSILPSLVFFYLGLHTNCRVSSAAMIPTGILM